MATEQGLASPVSPVILSQKDEGGTNMNMLAMGILGSSFLGIVMLTSPFITMQLRSPLPYMSTPRRKVLDALKEIERRKGKATRTAISSGTGTTTSTSSTTTNTSSVNKATTSSNKPLRYYDLGSGDGETVLAAASVGWRATGIELNSTLWAISSTRRLLTSIPVSSSSIPIPKPIRRNCNFVWGDMWKQPIHDADAVMIFGVKPLMKDIANKIATECRPGTFVMSYRFHVPIICADADTKTTTTIDNESNKSSVGMNVGTDMDNDKEGTGALKADLVYDKDEMRIYQTR